MGAHKISHIPWPSTEAAVWKKPKSDTLADLGEPPREAGGKKDSWESRC